MLAGKKMRPRYMGMALLAGLTALAWLAVALPARAAEAKPAAKQVKKPYIVVRSLDSHQKSRYKRQNERWTPFNLLKPDDKQPSVPERFEIVDRTEFHAFLVDTTGGKLGRLVVFSWYHRTRQTPFARPMAVPLVRVANFPLPVAEFSIWSDPADRGGLLSMAGLNSVMSKSDWDRSRVFGPRTLKVSRLAGWRTDPLGKKVPVAGELIAEASFEIHPRGVTVY